MANCRAEYQLVWTPAAAVSWNYYQLVWTPAACWCKNYMQKLLSQGEFTRNFTLNFNYIAKSSLGTYIIKLHWWLTAEADWPGLVKICRRCDMQRLRNMTVKCPLPLASVLICNNARQYWVLLNQDIPPPASKCDRSHEWHEQHHPVQPVSGH